MRPSEPVERPYEPDFTPDHGLLLKATLLLLSIVWITSSVLGLLRRGRRGQPPQQQSKQQQQQQQQQQQVVHPRARSGRRGAVAEQEEVSARADAASSRRAWQQQQERTPVVQHHDCLQRHSYAPGAGERPASASMQRGRSAAAAAAAAPLPPDQPFRFRAPDDEPPEQLRRSSWLETRTWSPSALQQQQQQQQQWQQQPQQQWPQQQQQQQSQHQQQWQPQPPPQQHGYATPARRASASARIQQQVPAEQQAQEPPVSGWDAELLLRCAAASPYISSVEALQRSPLFRKHISAARGRRLTYETAESNKLRVYRALRDVDPAGFVQLFSRRDVREFDEQPPPRWMAALEWLLSSALTAALLAGPQLAPAAAPLAPHAAALWALLFLLLAPRAGATSPAAALLGIYATHGPYCMLAPWWRLWAAALLDAGLLLLTLGLGGGLSLACRLLTAQRQGFGERLLRLVPMREVVRPMHFSPLPPRGSGGGGSWSDGAFSDDD